MAWSWASENSATSRKRCERTTRRCTPRRPSSSQRARELLAEPHPEAPDGYPFQLANRRNRHSMNSWLNELPGLHPSGKSNEVVIHPDDAAALGITDGDRVRVFSSVGAIELAASVNDRPRRGVVVVDHGWGSRIFDPRGKKHAGVLRRQPQPAHRRRARRPAVSDLGIELVVRRSRTRRLSSRPAGPRTADRRRCASRRAAWSTTPRCARRPA